MKQELEPQKLTKLQTEIEVFDEIFYNNTYTEESVREKLVMSLIRGLYESGCIKLTKENGFDNKIRYRAEVMVGKTDNPRGFVEKDSVFVKDQLLIRDIYPLGI